MSVALRPATRRPVLTWLVLVLAAGAWAAVVLDGHRGHAAGWSALGGWALMVVAMMAPPALPFLAMLRNLVSRRRRPLPLVAAGAATYLAVWTVVGALLLTGAEAAQRVAGWVGAPSGVLLGGALLLAGGYQFSPAKTACLTACRSPRVFAVRHWHGAAPLTETATVAAAYALSCVGCCAALMAVSLVAGAAALPVMVAIAVAGAAERLLPRGRGLVRPFGAVLLGAGFLVLTAALT